LSVNLINSKGQVECILPDVLTTKAGSDLPPAFASWVVNLRAAWNSSFNATTIVAPATKACAGYLSDPPGVLGVEITTIEFPIG
jgi:hypothetical protein